MMSLEIIVFIASILFGIVLYWRESKSNAIYKFFNTVFYSKELQMKDTSKKGFLYQQSFLMRLVYVSVLFLVGIVVVRFIIPIDLATLSLFVSSIFGTLLGTYLANFVFKSSEVIDEKGDSLEEPSDCKISQDFHNYFYYFKDFVNLCKIETQLDLLDFIENFDNSIHYWNKSWFEKENIEDDFPLWTMIQELCHN